MHHIAHTLLRLHSYCNLCIFQSYCGHLWRFQWPSWVTWPGNLVGLRLIEPGWVNLSLLTEKVSLAFQLPRDPTDHKGWSLHGHLQDKTANKRTEDVNMVGEIWIPKCQCEACQATRATSKKNDKIKDLLLVHEIQEGLMSRQGWPLLWPLVRRLVKGAFREQHAEQAGRSKGGGGQPRPGYCPACFMCPE